MQHLDPRKIISDGRWSDGSTEKLNISTDGVNGGGEGVSMKIHTKSKVAANLGPQFEWVPLSKACKRVDLTSSMRSRNSCYPTRGKSL